MPDIYNIRHALTPPYTGFIVLRRHVAEGLTTSRVTALPWHANAARLLYSNASPRHIHTNPAPT